MSANVSVLTNQGKEMLTVASTALQENVLAHVNGDFKGHNTVRVYNQPYVEPATGHVISSHTLRMTLTHPTLGVINVAMPCVPDSTPSGPLGGPPIVLKQPVSTQTVKPGDTVEISVVVASQVQPIYQWQKAETPSSPYSALANQTSSILVLTDVKQSDSGLYRVNIANQYGAVLSNAGTVTVQTP